MKQYVTPIVGLAISLSVGGCGALNDFGTSLATGLNNSLTRLNQGPVPEVESSATSEFDASDYKRLVVLVRSDMEDFDRDTGAMRGIEDAFVHKVMGKGYVIAARSNQQQIEQEQQKQYEEFTDDDAVELGRAFNTPAILVVSLRQLSGYTEVSSMENEDGENYKYDYLSIDMSARLLDVKTSELLWQGTGSMEQQIDNSTELADMVKSVASSLAGAIPSRDETESAKPVPDNGVQSETTAPVSS